MNVPFNLFYNIVDDSIYNLENDQRIADRLNSKVSGHYLKKIIIRRSSNQGKDIGGKMVLLDTWLRHLERDEYIVFLHDKTSPHKIQGREWKDKLFKIMESGFIEKAFSLFDKDKDTGIVAGQESIANEFDHSAQTFTSNNKLQLIQLQSVYKATTSDYQYVAGTMFWARSQPVYHFFRTHAPLDIRKTLEKGNIMDEKNGSITHAWERFLCWLITAQGYHIKGL